MITARLMTFSSSRTLPGQVCASIASIASGQKRHRAAPLLGGEPAHERMREQRGVALALAQRRNVDDDLGQPVVEVLAEFAGGDLVLEALVRRADDAHVDRDLLPAADALDHALLQEAQQLRLQRHRQVADLVQEQRAAVRPSRSCRSSASRRRCTRPSRSRTARSPAAFSGIAAQLMATKRWPWRGDRSCSARAKSSLPVPDSPRISTRRRRRRDLLDRAADPLHLRVARDDARTSPAPAARPAAAGSPPAARARGTRARSSR